MSEVEEAPRTHSGALLGVIAAALVAALGGLIWCYTLNSKLTTQSSELADAKQQQLDITPYRGAQIDALLNDIYATPPELIARVRAAMEAH